MNKYNIVKQIEILEVRYSVYLGSKSFEKLHFFLIGFLSAQAFYQIDDKSFSYNDFSEWVLSELKINDRSTIYSWGTIIPLYCNNDDEKAFDLFYTLFNKYKDRGANM